MAGYRFKKSTTRKASYYPYKNQFEKDIHTALKQADYEDKGRKVPYTTEAIYNPDFTFKSIPWLLIEAKGRFMGGSKEAAKYVWVSKCHPEFEIAFLFDNPTKVAYTGCRRRADGSVLTMGEWAAKNGFAFFAVKKIPKELILGTATREWLEAIKDSQYESYFGKSRR